MEEKAVLLVLFELCDRKGFDHWWFNIPTETRQEIIEELIKFVKQEKDTFFVEDTRAYLL